MPSLVNMSKVYRICRLYVYDSDNDKFKEISDFVCKYLIVPMH